jgi:hypothetical protein
MKKINFLKVPAADLARELSITRGGVSKAVSSGRLVENDDGTIDLSAPASYHWLSRRTLRAVEKDPEKRKAAERLLRALDKALPAGDVDDIEVSPVATIPTPSTPGGRELRERAAEAELESVILKRDTLSEKLVREQLETKQAVQELAPLALVTWAFSFNDRLFFEIFREIQYASPVLASHYMAGDTQAAEKYLKLRIESLIVQAEKDLREAIDKDGFDVRPFLRKALAAAKEAYGKDALDRKNVV